MSTACFLQNLGEGITTSATDVGMIKLRGFTVTQELSVFCFIFQLLNALKECLLSFLTVTNWTFHIEKSLSVAQEEEISSQHRNGHLL